MTISDDIKIQLKDIPIEQIAAKLDIKIKHHQSLCFMHDDHHPSLAYNTKLNTWKCYACNVHGDGIALVQQRLRYSFIDACTWLCNQFYIDNHRQTSSASSTRPPLTQTRHTIPNSKNTITTKPDIEVLQYILDQCKDLPSFATQFLTEERKYDLKVVRQLGIAFLSSNEELANAIVNAFGEHRALACGLVFKKSNRYTLYFYSPALLFPYYDTNGNLLNVQARYLGKSDRPRFQFPKNSAVPSYNLPVLRTLANGDDLYIAEGVTDCIALLSDGYKAIAIPSATLLKSEDLQILAHYSLKMFPDNDQPGEHLFNLISNGIAEYGGSIERLSLPDGIKDYSEFHVKCTIERSITKTPEATEHTPLKNGKKMELVINTYGASINRENEAFVISNTEGRQRVPIDRISSIQIGRGVQITSDAILLAVAHEIDIYFNDKTGQPVGRVWSPKYGSISTIRKGQLNFTFAHDALTWIKDVISKKIENQQALLLMLRSDAEDSCAFINKAITRLEDYRNKIRNLEGEIVSDVAPSLRGWEGQASKVYFDALNHFLPDELRFANRSQKPAFDVVNAFLNYGYGMLYGKIEGALIKAGIDPYIGVLHRDDYNRPVLVYDVIELYRVWVDYVVYSIVSQGIVTDEYYSVRDDGSYWLENIGRRVLIQSMNDYLDEIVVNNKLQRSRLTQIQLYCQHLAQLFKTAI